MSDRKTIEKSIAGNSGTGIVIALVLMAACFMAGRFFAGGSAGGPGGGPGMMMPGMGGGAAPAVKVLKVSNSYIDMPIEYIGYVEAQETVELVPQVGGYLEKVNFDEGSFVKKGQVLFQIEQRQYQAELEMQKARLNQAQATLAQAEKLLGRLNAVDPKSISQLDLDNAESAVATGKAFVQECEANVILAEIDLARTQIISPIDGYIGKALVTEGNFVSSSTGTLARVVKSDPVRVVFSLSDSDYMKMIDKFSDGLYNIAISLSDGSMIDQSGSFDFEDNQINQGTATIALRALFDNEERKLIPGAYVNVILTDKDRSEGIIIPHSAVLNTADGKIVYVVDAENKVQVRPIVTAGETQNGIVVESGLNVDDVVVIQGLQKIQPGAEVIAQM